MRFLTAPTATLLALVACTEPTVPVDDLMLVIPVGGAQQQVRWREGALVDLSGQEVVSAGAVERYGVREVLELHARIQQILAAKTGLTVLPGRTRPTFRAGGMPFECDDVRRNFDDATERYFDAQADYWHAVISFDILGDAEDAKWEMVDAADSMTTWYEVGQINGCW